MKHFLFCFVVAGVLLTSLTSCKTTEALQDIVNHYCTADTVEREYLRNKIDQITEPHHIRVYCENDPVSATEPFKTPGQL
jgi:hypothetical protein